MWCKQCLYNLQFGFSVVFVTKPLCNSSITENVCRIIECHVSITVAHDVIVTWHITPDSTVNCCGLPSSKLFTIIIPNITGIYFLIVIYIYILMSFLKTYTNKYSVAVIIIEDRYIILKFWHSLQIWRKWILIEVRNKSISILSRGI